MINDPRWPPPPPKSDNYHFLFEAFPKLKVQMIWLNFVNLLMLHFYLKFLILLLYCICLWQYFAFKYFSLQLQFPTNNEEISQRCKSLDGLQIALRTQPHSFVSRFLESNGLQCLLNLLSGMDWETAQSNIHTAALGCVKAELQQRSSKILPRQCPHSKRFLSSNTRFLALPSIIDSLANPPP